MKKLVLKSSSEIYEKGLKVFDNNEKNLRDWLYNKNLYINNERPIDVINNKKYKNEIINELNRIEYSGFS